MQVTIDVSQEIDWDRQSNVAQHALHDALAEGLPVIVADAKASFTPGPHSRHTNAPGDGPHNRTGEMSSSIGFDISWLVGRVTCSDWKARMVEYGTKGYHRGEKRQAGGVLKDGQRSRKVKTVTADVPARKARPFLGPAVFNDRPRMIERIKRHMAARLTQST